MEKSAHQKATQMIIDLQDKNAKLRFGLGKLLAICDNTNQRLISEVWQQKIGIAKQVFEETETLI